jgi:hypothetical protein
LTERAACGIAGQQQCVACSGEHDKRRVGKR